MSLLLLLSTIGSDPAKCVSLTEDDRDLLRAEKIDSARDFVHKVAEDKSFLARLDKYDEAMVERILVWISSVAQSRALALTRNRFTDHGLDLQLIILVVCGIALTVIAAYI